MIPRPRLFLLGVLLVLPALAAQPPGVAVKGLVREPLTIGAGELASLPQREFEDTRLVGPGAPRGEAARKYKGVLLRDVLNRAGLVEAKPRDLRKTLIVVDAHDGYRALFTWAELFLSPVGDGVYLVTERDGKPIARPEGPIALLSLNDRSPGPRHVRQVASIDVRLVAD